MASWKMRCLFCRILRNFVCIHSYFRPRPFKKRKNWAYPLLKKTWSWLSRIECIRSHCLMSVFKLEEVGLQRKHQNMWKRNQKKAMRIKKIKLINKMVRSQLRQNNHLNNKLFVAFSRKFKLCIIRERLKNWLSHLVKRSCYLEWCSVLRMRGTECLFFQFRRKCWIWWNSL